MSIQEATIERKTEKPSVWGYIACLGWGMGLAGALMLSWAGGVQEGTVPAYLIKGAFPACPHDQVQASGVGNEMPTEVVSYPFVASKRGTKYYPADCPAGASLSAKNRIGFASEDDARAAGYTLSASC